MDYNIVLLEITDHITHFDYFDRLVSAQLAQTSENPEEQDKIRKKNKEHLTDFLKGLDIYDAEGRLRQMPEITTSIRQKLETMKNKEIHELIEKLEKDVKKMRKLYRRLNERIAGNAPQPDHE